MALPVVIVASGGYPMNRLSAHGGLPVTLAAQGLAVTEAPAGYGTPMTFVTEGGSVVLPVPPVSFTTKWSNTDKTGSYTFSNGDLTLTTTSIEGAIRGTAKQSAGKFYFEYRLGVANFDHYGLALATTNLANFNTDKTGSVTLLKSNGNIYIASAPSGSTLGTRATNDVIGIAVNTTGDLIWFRVAPLGNWNGSGTANPETGVGGINIIAINGELLPLYYNGSGSGTTITANFGASAFVGTVPVGFTAGWPT